MLILTRKPGESLFIGDKIKVTVVEVKGNQIRIGIVAPPQVRILREEIFAPVMEENQSAAAPVSGDSLEGLSAVITTAAETSAGQPSGSDSTGDANSGNGKRPRVGQASALSHSFRKATSTATVPTAAKDGAVKEASGQDAGSKDGVANKTPVKK